MNIHELYQIFRQHPSIQTDTRKLQKGDFFFALKGPNFNANAFAKQALDSGAAYVVIDDANFYIDERTIVVSDVLQTLQQLANYHRKQFQIPIVAITGSNGKTTTKELIHAVLSSQYKRTDPRGTVEPI
jgi:UDP-N-acetylmuramoyl-tripeptide--D-alanyl-D-alanine ligase